MNGGAVIWTRDTPWRQGHVLPLEAVRELGLVHPAGVDATCVVVSTHDCDLVNHDLEVEPDVEVIVGRLPGEVDGNFSWAKSPRTLHIEAVRDGATVTIELVATAKRLVPKVALAAFKPHPAWSLSGPSLSVLGAWLAVRYKRAAFPDAFVERLAQSKVSDGLAKLIKPMHYLLSAVLVDVDDGKEIDRTDGSTYAITVVLVFPPGDDPEKTADEVDNLAEKVQELFARRYYNIETEAWAGVELKSCLAISEDDLPVSQAKKLTEWRFEHMTLKEEADGR